MTLLSSFRARVASFLLLVIFVSPQVTTALRAESGSDSDLALEEDSVPEIQGATKHPIPLSMAPQNTSVITRRQIQELNPRDLGELFRLMPGVDVTVKAAGDFDVGASGLNKDFSNRMLVLLDGKPVMSSLYGHTWWRELPIIIDTIERIEVVKGPSSAQYGANAFAGVINIVTDFSSPRTREGERVAASAGSRDLGAVTVRTARWLDDWGYTLTLNAFGSDGITPLVQLNGVPSTGFEDIGNRFDKLTGVLDVEREWENTKASVRVSRVHNETDVPGQFARFSSPLSTDLEVDSTYSYFDLTHRLSPKRAVSFKLQSNFVKTLYGQSPFFETTLDPRRRQEDGFLEGEIQGRSYLGESRYIYGYNYRRTTSDGPFIEGSEKLTQTQYAYGQMEYEFNPDNLGFLGLILYHQNRTGFDFSPKANFLHKIEENEVVRFGWGTAFRAPDAVANFINPLSNLPLRNVVPGLQAGAPATTPALMGLLGLDAAQSAAVVAAAQARQGAAAGGYGTFLDLNGQPTPLFIGNKELENESIEQVDFGYEKRTEDQLLKFDTWYSVSENLITPGGGTPGPDLAFAPGIDYGGLGTAALGVGALDAPIQAIFNAGFSNLVVDGFRNQGTFNNQTARLHSRGAHIEVGRKITSKLTLTLNHTWQKVTQVGAVTERNPDTGVTTKEVAFAPANKTNIIARLETSSRGTLTAVASNVSSYFTSGLESVGDGTRLPDFSTVDLAYRHFIGPARDTWANLAIKNVFDEKHHEFIRRLDFIEGVAPGAFGGILQDRTWILTATHQF